MIELHELTPTERRLYSVLCDGAHHHRQELIESLGDQETSSFGAHMYNLRRKLRPHGISVTTMLLDGRSTYYLGRYVKDDK